MSGSALLQVQVGRRLRHVGVVVSSLLPVLGVVSVQVVAAPTRRVSEVGVRGALDVVVVVVVEVSPLPRPLVEILVIEVPAEGLAVLLAHTGGGLGLAQVRLVGVRQLPLRSVAAFLLAVAVIDPVGFLAVLDCYRSAGPHDGAGGWNTNT